MSDQQRYLVDTIKQIRAEQRLAPRARWAIVTSLSPLRVRLEEDDLPLLGRPSTLVHPSLLAVGQKVEVLLQNQKVTIQGVAGGTLPQDNPLADEWMRVVPAEAGPNQTIDPITGIITTSQPSSANQMKIRVPFEDGYEYKFDLYLNVYSGSPTESSLWFNLSKDNVVPSVAGYQTAGQYAAFNSTGGTYVSNAGIGGAIGFVSGQATYNPFRTTLILKTQPGTERKWFWFEFESMTQGSARSTNGRGYTPGHPSGADWDGINFYCPGTVGRFYGEYHVLRRKVR